MPCLTVNTQVDRYYERERDTERERDRQTDRDGGGERGEEREVIRQKEIRGQERMSNDLRENTRERTKFISLGHRPLERGNIAHYISNICNTHGQNKRS